MSNLLYVGDPHATVAELPDLRALMGLIHKVAKQQHVDGVVFLGDQYHHHGIVHLEVMDFWMKSIKSLSELTRTFLMVGNHDKPGNGRSDIHAMMIHEGQGPMVKVIDRPSVFQEAPGAVFLPHMDRTEDFLAACHLHKDVPLVVCHQTFNGGRYENGFYAKDGIDPELVPQERIWSGHIHAPQEFGKVWYLGAPRWRTSADANTERHLWVVTHQAGEAPKVKAKFPTGAVCRQIIHLDVNETTDLDAVLGPQEPQKDNITVTMTGSGEWLKTFVPRLERDGFRVRTVNVGLQLAPRVRESEGIGTAFRKFTKGYQAKNGTPVEVLEKMAVERISHV